MILFNEGDWVRTCQECGCKQVSKKPNQEKELSDSYRNAKCKNNKCQSEALDYGSTYTTPVKDESDE